MLALIVFLLMPKSPLTTSELTFLAHIRQAVAHMSDKRASFVRFEKGVTASDAAHCGKLLLKVAPNSADYASCAFAQAYYGLDYDANLQRLLRPYRLWHLHISKWEQEYPNDTQGDKPTDLDSVYVSLNWLYLKHHDLKSLVAWMDLRLDGGWAEGSDGELSDLWKRHKADMLKAASASTRRLENLCEALIFGDGGDEGLTKRHLIADLKPYLHNKDNRISRAAQKLNRLVYLDKSE